MSKKARTVRTNSRRLRERIEAWEEQHRVELGSGRKPRFVTPSGFELRPAYTPAELDELGWEDLTDLGLPGEYPYTRGRDAAGYRNRFWHWEFYAGFGSAEAANRRYRFLLEQGATGGVSIALDLPTQIGLDSDHPLAKGEAGRVGVALTSLADVERLFTGIDIKQAGHVFTTANAIGPIFLAWIIALCEKRGIDPGTFTLQIQNDPVKEYVARGTQIFPIRPAVKLAADAISYCARHYPNWLPISVSGSHMKQAGGSCLQEAAFTINNAIAYVEAVRSQGLHVDQFGPGIEIHFCTDMEFFEEVAKHRATRKVWAQLMRERWGATNPLAIRGRLHSATSGLPLTAQQPKNNIIRLTLQVLAQVLGGIQGGRTASYDEALAIPTEEAVTLAVRTNQIIAHETGIADVVDPLGGSYYVEWLTKKMEDGIWEYIGKIDGMGGALAAVENGFYAGELAEGAYRQQRALESGETVIVGVNKYRTDEEPDVPIFRHDPETERRQIAWLEELRRTRDARAVERALGRLKQVTVAGENVLPATLEAVKAYATVGEICDVWRSVLGEFTDHPARI
ncbi:MAG: methylmalonyl-CoA mutase [Candidatus Rokubacteria bacterium]|nr:methylmalonyl-CoA mutase [Candidatus Rokubacteria bacterium]